MKSDNPRLDQLGGKILGIYLPTYVNIYAMIISSRFA